jgi:hypothetical protein
MKGKVELTTELNAAWEVYAGVLREADISAGMYMSMERDWTSVSRMIDRSTRPTTTDPAGEKQ